MDAEQMNLPDASFDWVMCGFALWMFAEPVRVLQEFYRVLKCRGRIALSTRAADNPSQTWCNEVLRPFVYAPAAKELPAKFDSRFDTPLQLETALLRAGFADTQISVKESTPLVVLVRPEDYRFMISMFLATKAWVLKRSFTLE